MHRASQEQVTQDAAYKFALWTQLLREPPSASLEDEGEESAAAAYMNKLVWRDAISLVRQYLPRKTVEPCCITGVCGSSRTIEDQSLIHRALHIGRREVHLTDDARDSTCFCLAHACGALQQPADLLLRGYQATQIRGAMMDRFRGLRCLLLHVQFREVRVEHMPDQVEAARVLHELATLLREERRSEQLCALHLHDFSRSTSADFALLLRVLAQQARLSSLRCLSIDGSGLETLTEVVQFLRLCPNTLSSLSLRGTTQLADPTPNWLHLAEAVARQPCLQSLDVSACGWGETTLETFLSGLVYFTPRPSFELNLSSNDIGRECIGLMVNAAQKASAFCQNLTGIAWDHLALCAEDERVVVGFFEQYPALVSMSLACVTFAPPSGVQRLVRAMGRDERAWKQVMVGHSALPVAVLKRLPSLHYATEGAALSLAHHDLREQLAKLNLASCLVSLTTLDLSFCNLCASGVSQLASAIEKCAPVKLERLNLRANAVGGSSSMTCRSPSQASKPRSANATDSSFPYLCKALRSSCAPHLRELDLSENPLPARSVVSLIEQVSDTMRHLHLSKTDLFDAAPERTMVLVALMRRQKSSHAFPSWICRVWALHIATGARSCWVVRLGSGWRVNLRCDC